MPDVDSTYILVASILAGAMGWLVNQLWQTVMSKQEETDEHLIHQIGALEDEDARLEEMIRRVSLEGREGRKQIREDLKTYARADTVQALGERVDAMREELRQGRVSQDANFKKILDKLDE